MSYFNAAGHGLPDPAVRARMIAYMRREDEIGPAEAEADAKPEMDAVRARAAAVIGAAPEDVALMHSTTHGWNAAVLALPLAGRRVLVAPGEWSSGIAVLGRMGARIEVMAHAPDGTLLPGEIAGQIDEDLAAICLPLVCSQTGERYPAVEIGRLPRPEATLLIVDAAQAVGQMPVSVGDLGCDVLAATTRKWLRGPRGTALLYVSAKALRQMAPNPAPDYGALAWDGTSLGDVPGARRFEPMGTFAPQRLGLGVALGQFLDADHDALFAALAARAGRIRTVAGEAGYDLAGPDGGPRTAITTLRGTPERIGALAARLAEAGFTVKDPGTDCEPMRSPEMLAGGFLRISPHLYNTAQEIEALSALLPG